MYMGYNKIDIDILCEDCLNKITEVNDFTVEQLYNIFYNAPEFADNRNNHQMINSIIVRALLNDHGSCGCLTRIYSYG